MDKHWITFAAKTEPRMLFRKGAIMLREHLFTFLEPLVFCSEALQRRLPIQLTQRNHYQPENHCGYLLVHGIILIKEHLFTSFYASVLCPERSWRLWPVNLTPPKIFAAGKILWMRIGQQE